MEYSIYRVVEPYGTIMVFKEFRGIIISMENG